MTKKESLIASTTATKYPWIITVADGYMCSLCVHYGKSLGTGSAGSGGGAWVNTPLPHNASRKLAKKAAKHNVSAVHKICVEAAELSSKKSDVATKLIEAGNAQSAQSASATKSLFHAAHFLFSNEIAHTTNWRSLISTLALCDQSRELEKYLKNCPANAHHLSTTSVTQILECFGETIQDTLVQRFEGVTEYAVMADECTDINRKEMVSVCIRIVEQPCSISEVFIGSWPVSSTSAEDVTNCIVNGLKSVALNPEHIVAAAFDGAANMSGKHGGVQALLRRYSPNLVFVHCRSHLLQLALVRSANSNPEVKRVIGVVNKLYALVSHSPKRLAVLTATQLALDGVSHKLVQPGETRWLSYDGSLAVICTHYAALCAALEAIYADAADLSCEAGGLLLEMRKQLTVFLVCLLHRLFQPLARLSRLLQECSSSISSAMTHVRVTIDAIENLNCRDLLSEEFAAIKEKCAAAGVRLDGDVEEEIYLKAAKKFVIEVTRNLRARFSDDISELCGLQNVLKEKVENPENVFKCLCKLFGSKLSDLMNEWKILKRIDVDLSSRSEMINVAISSERKMMFPELSRAVRMLLLLPLGTATVERSFSTMNRILCSERCRLLPLHVRHLMLFSIEGPTVPDVRDGSTDQRKKVDKFIDGAYRCWMRQPRRL